MMIVSEFVPEPLNWLADGRVKISTPFFAQTAQMITAFDCKGLILYHSQTSNWSMPEFTHPGSVVWSMSFNVDLCRHVQVSTLSRLTTAVANLTIGLMPDSY